MRASGEGCTYGGNGDPKVSWRRTTMSDSKTDGRGGALGRDSVGTPFIPAQRTTVLGSPTQKRPQSNFLSAPDLDAWAPQSSLVSRHLVCCNREGI